MLTASWLVIKNTDVGPLFNKLVWNISKSVTQTHNIPLSKISVVRMPSAGQHLSVINFIRLLHLC